MEGIDLSNKMLEQARKKLPGIHLIRGDVTSLPFMTETFNGAFAVQVLHHVQKKGGFLKEVHRVLKPGSRIALHSCSHDQMRAFWFYHCFPEGLDIDLARFPDAGDIYLLLENAGFSNIGVEVCYHDVVVSNETPERYLDKNYRDGVSTFAFMTDDDIAKGCNKIRTDIVSGESKRIVRQCDAIVENEIGGSYLIFGQKIIL
jgi:SAM-dependent methyltransferase